MPDPFPEICLGDVAADRAGSFVDGPFGSSLKSSEYTESGVRLIQLQNIGIGEWIDENRKFISEKKFKTLSRHGAEPGDIAIAKMADPVARACLLPKVADRFIVVADCMKLTPDDARFDPKYLVYAINSEATRKEAERKSTGTTRLRINLTALKTVGVSAPLLPEQRQIAEILGTLDEAIRKTEAIIAKLKQVKQGLLHDLLTRGIDDNGELRDPESHPEQFKDSPLGRIPREWELRDVGDIAEVFNGTTPSRAVEEYWGGEVPWLSSGKVNDYHIASPSEFVTQRALDQTSLKLVPRGSVVVGMIGQGKTRGMSAHLAIAATINQNLAAIVPHDGLSGVYLHILLHHNYQRLRRGGRGSNQDALNCQLIKQFPIAVPPSREQRRVEQAVLSFEARYDFEQAEVAKQRLLKQGLMEDLLTGRVRVTNLLEEAAE